tara:strand:+ start:470 stop:907 length:438 start_codon:yes stop_codon:yes gene_type:complete
MKHLIFYSQILILVLLLAFAFSQCSMVRAKDICESPAGCRVSMETGECIGCISYTQLKKTEPISTLNTQSIRPYITINNSKIKLYEVIEINSNHSFRGWHILNKWNFSVKNNLHVCSNSNPITPIHNTGSFTCSNEVFKYNIIWR